MEVNALKLFKEPLTALVTQNLYDSFLSKWFKEKETVNKKY